MSREKKEKLGNLIDAFVPGCAYEKINFQQLSNLYYELFDDALIIEDSTLVKNILKRKLNPELSQKAQSKNLTVEIGIDLEKKNLISIMYKHKTEMCNKLDDKSHNSQFCRFYHNLRDKRRPLLETNYSEQPCTAVFIKGEYLNPDDWGAPTDCRNGEKCPFSHNKYEVVFHSGFYKVNRCKSLHENKIVHSLCSFAHMPSEARKPFSGIAHLQSMGKKNANLESKDKQKAIDKQDFKELEKSLAGLRISSKQDPKKKIFGTKFTYDTPKKSKKNSKDVEEIEAIEKNKEKLESQKLLGKYKLLKEKERAYKAKQKAKREKERSKRELEEERIRKKKERERDREDVETTREETTRPPSDDEDRGCADSFSMSLMSQDLFLEERLAQRQARKRHGKYGREVQLLVDLEKAKSSLEKKNTIIFEKTQQLRACLAVLRSSKKFDPLFLDYLGVDKMIENKTFCMNCNELKALFVLVHCGHMFCVKCAYRIKNGMCTLCGAQMKLQHCLFK